MVGGEQVHHVVGEVRHVLANEEAQVSSLDQLELDDRVADLFSGPLGIDCVSKRVSFADEHRDGDVSADCIEWNQVGMFVLPDVEPVVVVWSPNLETVLAHVLSVEHDALG